MNHQQEGRHPANQARDADRREVAERDDRAATAPRARRRWMPATAIVGGVVVAAALTGTSIANAADEGGTPTGAPSASTSASTSVSPSATPGSSDSSAPTPASGAVPAPATDGPVPATDGPAPGPVTDGAAPPSGGLPPSPPAGGPGSTPPAGGPGNAGRPAPGGPAADGSTRVLGVVTALDNTSITVRTDTGESVTASLTDATTYRPTPPTPGADPSSATTSKPAVGERVELRVLDGAAVDAGVVRAHADGTIVSTSGTSAVLSTREGLRVTLDLSAAGATVAVGDQVHAEGSANQDGSAIVVNSLRTDG